MAIPELVRRSAEKQLAEFCRLQSAADRVEDGRLTWEGARDHLTLMLERVIAGQPMRRPLARFSFSQELGQWTLHHLDNRGRWVFYLNAGASLDFSRLLKVLAADPLHFFWPE